MDEVVVTPTLPTVNARIHPRGGLDVLSRDEVARLRDASSGGMHELLRRCALAVLTTGSTSDDPRAARELYPDFDIQVLQQDRGLRLELPVHALLRREVVLGPGEVHDLEEVEEPDQPQHDPRTAWRDTAADAG